MIIPNWHPVFVHFTVALIIVSALLYAATLFVKGPLREQWIVVARWTLWLGMGMTVITGLTGLYAYNTVAHDTPSHLAMTEHRNWALATIAVILLLGAFSLARARGGNTHRAVFSAAMLAAALLVMITAWHGGELVYRYGLGVMSLPKVENHGHGPSEGAAEHMAPEGDAPHTDTHSHEHSEGGEPHSH